MGVRYDKTEVTSPGRPSKRLHDDVKDNGVSVSLPTLGAKKDALRKKNEFSHCPCVGSLGF